MHCFNCTVNFRAQNMNTESSTVRYDVEIIANIENLRTKTNNNS